MTTTAGAPTSASSGPGSLTYEFDRTGTFTAVSDGFCSVLGWRRDELLGTFAPSLVHPEDRGRLVEQGTHFIEGRHGFDPVWRVRHASGDYRWYRVEATPLLDDAGEVAGALAVLEDVDQAQAARDALVESERRYRLLVQNSQDVVGHQVDGLLHWISPSVTALSGWTPDELVGRPTLHLWHPDDQQQAQRIPVDAAEGGPTSALMRLRRKDGSYVHVDVGVHGLDGHGVVVTLRDATERVAALEALQARESELRLIAENAGDMVALSSLDGRLEWVSPSIERLLGVTPGQMVGRSLAELLHPDDVAARTAAMEACDSDQPTYFEARYRRASGGYAWLGAHISPVHDESGAVVGRLGTTREISAEVQARHLLEQREAEYRMLAENAADIVYRLDGEQRIVWISPSVRAVLGHRVEDVLGMRADELLHPDDRDRRETAIRSLDETGRTAFEARYRRSDGSYCWLAITGHPLQDGDGRTVGRIGSARAIDAEMAARNALEQSESRFRLLAQNSVDVVVSSRLDGVAEWVSPSVSRVLGWAPEELVGRDFTELLHPDDRARRDDTRRRAGQGLASGYLARYRHREGRWVWMSVSGAPMVDESGAVVGVVGSARDATFEVEARDALRRSEAMFRLLAENAADIVFRADPTMVIEWVSPSVTASIGWAQHDFVGHRITDWVHPDDLPVLMAANSGAEAEATSVYEGRFRCADGGYRWFGVVVRSLTDASGAVVARVGSARDISDAVAARDALQSSEAMFRSVMDSSTLGMAVIGPDLRFRAVNPALCRLAGREERWFLDHTATDLAPPARRREDAGAAERFKTGAGTVADVVRLHRADGTEIAVRRVVVPVRDASGELSYLVAQLQDISAELELEYTSFHDSLTGLRNRQWIVDILEEELRVARRAGSSVGVLFIDLDNFKVVNDSLGHVAGDEVLATVAYRLTSTMRPGDHVGRFGGDEFVVVIPEIDEVPDLERICERVLSGITPQIEVEGHRISPTASIGVAISTLDSSAQSLLRDADSALYRAKSAGKQRWHFADEAMHAQAVARLTTEDELRRALAEHELVVHYQPIVHLADREVVGHEALVRWQHPTRGLVPPLDFLPVAEDSGLIVEMGDEVLRLVCAMLVARPDLQNVSVNLSPLQLARPWWREKLLSQLLDQGVDPSRISVEVTETAVLDNREDVARELSSLRSLGVGVHLDDFGTGYSSIALLRDLPITGLKLDMSFTRRLTGDGGTTEVLAEGLAKLADGLGMIGIAEGVETEEQAALLAAMGWTHGQGWLFGRPVPDPVTVASGS